MVGLDITIACPCCKKLSGVNIGITEYYNYNSKIYAMVSCPKCRKKLLVNDNSNAVSSFDLIQMNGNGYKQSIISAGKKTHRLACGMNC